MPWSFSLLSVFTESNGLSELYYCYHLMIYFLFELWLTHAALLGLMMMSYLFFVGALLLMLMFCNLCIYLLLLVVTISIGVGLFWWLWPIIELLELLVVCVRYQALLCEWMWLYGCGFTKWVWLWPCCGLYCFCPFVFRNFGTYPLCCRHDSICLCFLCHKLKPKIIGLVPMVWFGFNIKIDPSLDGSNILINTKPFFVFDVFTDLEKVRREMEWR